MLVEMIKNNAKWEGFSVPDDEITNNGAKLEAILNQINLLNSRV